MKSVLGVVLQTGYTMAHASRCRTQFKDVQGMDTPEPLCDGFRVRMLHECQAVYLSSFMFVVWVGMVRERHLQCTVFKAFSHASCILSHPLSRTDVK